MSVKQLSMAVWCVCLAVLLVAHHVAAQNVTYNVAATMAWLNAQGCQNASSNPTCPGGNPCYDAEFTARALAAGSVVNLNPNDPNSAPYQTYSAMNNVYDLTTQDGLISFLRALGWYMPQPPGCSSSNPNACFPQGSVIVSQNSWQQPIVLMSLGDAMCSCWSPLTTNGPHCDMDCGWFGGTELYSPPVPAIVGPLFGSFTPNNQTFQDFTAWPNMENTPEDAINQAISVVEVGWSHADAANVENTLNTIWNIETAVPLISWMPYNYKTWTSPTPNADVVSGKYDDYIDQFLTMLASWVQGKRAYLRFAPQPNGNWFPWNPTCPWACSGQRISQSAKSYADMWNYVMGKVSSPKYGFTKDELQIMFDVNSVDANASYPMEKFYPGDSTIDWVGITGYNWANSVPGNNWSTPSQIFSSMTSRVKALSSTKKFPRAISSASSSAQNGLAGKAAWIPTLFQYALDSSAKMLIYHNVDTNTDLAVFGGEKGTSTWTSPLSQVEYNVFQTYSVALNNADFGVQGQNASEPLMISTAQFLGNF
jgi:mannan endo-1,4-beta-mannosidase